MALTNLLTLRKSANLQVCCRLTVCLCTAFHVAVSQQVWKIISRQLRHKLHLTKDNGLTWGTGLISHRRAHCAASCGRQSGSCRPAGSSSTP